MAQQVLKPVNFTVSLLSLALLSACGGGGKDNVSFIEGGTATFLGPANKDLDPTNQPDQTVGVFLANEIPGGNVTLSKLGQQNSPSVAIVDVDHSGAVAVTAADVVAYDQVAFVSAVCLFGECPNSSAVVTYNKGIIDEITTKLNEEKAKDAAKQDKEKIAKLESQLKAQQALVPPSNVYAVVDVNGEYNRLGPYFSVDDAPFGEKVEIDDAGTSKIDYERVNGNLVTTGGTIDRRFNGIYVMKEMFTPGGGNRTAYFRYPAAPGWSFQTFARYYSTPNKRILETRRDLLQGYQSIGQPTQVMPDTKKADYEGLTHALFNGNQVTMLNKIHANFGKRTLEYKTEGAAILHTFENTNGMKNAHIIEKRPDLNLSGSATWAKGRPDFVGNIESANGLKGKLEGRFYGPDAAEIGGVFGMKGVVRGETVHYIGGFGAKRP